MNLNMHRAPHVKPQIRTAQSVPSRRLPGAPGRIISPAEFARLATDGPTNGMSIYSDGAVDAITGDGSRSVPYILSDSSVARDGHTIATEGWQLDNFRRNPVFLFAHDTSQPPVGQFTNIGVSGSKLRGTVLYADEQTYPFADTIFRLVKGKFLRAVSVSWDPLTWKFSTDKNRPGGIDFLTQDLLEVSQVPVPAAPGALAQARASGINTGLLYDWAERVLDTGDGVIPRATAERIRKDAAEPRSRAGKKISAASAGKIAVAQDHARACIAALDDLLEEPGDTAPQGVGDAAADADNERARAQAKVRLLKLGHDDDTRRAAQAEPARDTAPATQAEALARVAELRRKHPGQ